MGIKVEGIERNDVTVINGKDVRFFIIPSVTTKWGKYKTKQASKLYYDALLIETNLQVQQLSWVHEASKTKHDIIVEMVRSGEIQSVSELVHQISKYVTRYGFAPVRLVSTKKEWFL